MSMFLPGLNFTDLSKHVLLEFVGTFLLVFAAGAAVCLPISERGIGLSAAIVWGFLIVGLTYAMLSTSGANFNPAVSFGKAIVGDLGWIEMLGYWIGQIVGAFVAGAILYWFFGKQSGVGESVGEWTNTQKAKAIVFEIIITTIFVLVFLHMTVPRRGVNGMIARTEDGGIQYGGWTSSMAPLAIGLTFTALMLTAYFWTGGSMNPARSLALGVYANNMRNVWIYIVGPLVGAILAAALHKLILVKVRNTNCQKVSVTARGGVVSDLRQAVSVPLEAVGAVSNKVANVISG